MHTHDHTAPQQKEFSIQLKDRSELAKIYFMLPLETVISDKFDFAKFEQSIKSDRRLSDYAKKNILSAFTPKTPIHMDMIHPELGIREHLTTASITYKPRDRLTETEALADNHPVKQMWDEVWQQTLKHYAKEATMYERAVVNAGSTLEEAFDGYPAKTPPIVLNKKMPLINASAGVNRHMNIEATVTPDFLTQLTTEEQRAILYHEAQHAFEPVLSMDEPFTAFLKNGLKSRMTMNAATRKWEDRADAHAGHMGEGEALQSALQKLEASAQKFKGERTIMFEHLLDCGFELDAKKFAATLTEANQIMHDAKPDAMSKAQNMPSATSRANEEVLAKRTQKINEELKEAIKPKSQGKFAHITSRVSGAIHERTSSHPSTKKRVEQLKKVPACEGCDPKSPSTSHADRLTQISKNGLQGWQQR